MRDEKPNTRGQSGRGTRPQASQPQRRTARDRAESDLRREPQVDGEYTEKRSASSSRLGKARALAGESDISARIRDFLKQPYSREAVVGAGLGLAFTVMVGRLAYLQAFATGELSIDAKIERTARRILPHKRGAIYDRNGVVLARSVDAVDIAAHPNLITDVNATANLLVSVLGGDASTYAQKLSKDTTYEYLVRKADPEMADRLRSTLAETNKARKAQGLSELGGFEFENTSRRVYPMGSIAGNVVGCIGIDGHGLTGLELEYDSILGGTDGWLIQERSKYGTPIVGGQDLGEPPVDGESIVISIDVDIQRAVQDELLAVIDRWEAGNACAIVMAPETGELLACASTPFLDPSDIATAPAEAFNLRCVSDSYEPGSTVKPVTASMAIDLGIAVPETIYYAPATIQVGDDVVGDADDRDYDIPDMSLTEMLERSSNVGAVLCAESIGAVQFATYLSAYGIGSDTGVDYPGEVPGLVTKLENYTGAWQAMAFGQSLAVPPVQMARAVGAIANGGVALRPHFAVSRNGHEIAYPTGTRVVASETAHQVALMMESVTDNGYGAPGAIEGYRLSTKTGTAERVDPTTGHYMSDRFLVSFIGFGPTDDPKALVYVIVDYVPRGGSGSETAAEPWRNIMQVALSRLQVAPSY